MATIAKFRDPTIVPPKPFTTPERKVWSDAVDGLRAAGTLRHARRRRLIGFVKREMRLQEIIRDRYELDTTRERLDALAARLELRDRLTIHEAIVGLAALELAGMATQRRLSDAQWRFLREHRMTPGTARTVENDEC